MIRVRSFRITGIGESDLDTLIAPVYTKYTNPVTTVLSSPGDLWVHLRAQSNSEAQADALLSEVGDPIAELLGDRAYSELPKIRSNLSSVDCFINTMPPSLPLKAALVGWLPAG